MTSRATRRRASDDHVHTEYWTVSAHDRFDDRLSREIHEMRADLKALGTRLAWLLGGLGVVVFVANIVADRLP